MTTQRSRKSIFYEPGVFTAWGLRTGQWDGETLAAKVAASGFKWICQSVLEADDDHMTDLCQGCRKHGLYFGIWDFNPHTLDNVERLHPNFWIPNVESDHWDGYDAMLTEFRQKHPLLPAGVIHNTDLDPAPWIKHNFKCIPECYLPDNTNLQPQTMVWTCKRMGWKLVFPCFGVYHDFPLANYSLEGSGASGWSVYLPEEMQDEDWAEAARRNQL